MQLSRRPAQPSGGDRHYHRRVGATGRLERGGAPIRTIRVRLRGAAANQPLEGDCTAGACQCGAGIVGRDIVLDLPGGSGQLVALSMLNTTLLDPPEPGAGSREP